MHTNFFFKFVLIVVSLVFFVSCDKEYSAVGDALLGDNNFELTSDLFSVVAYNEEVTPVESNGFPVNALGIYDNPAFGKTIASFSTQVILASVNPTINPALKQEIESVYIDIPYFVDATQTKPTTNSSGAAAGNTYVLDSIYGAPLSKIKLSVYESGLYMGNQNGVSQKFYTNQNTKFDSYKVGSRLNDDPNKSQNDEFFFNPAQNTVTTNDATGKEIITYSAPSMRLKLNSTFFKDKILNAPAESLVSNDVFINYFRGLYFKVEQSGADKGQLALLNFARGTITIKYKEDTSTTVPTRIDKSIVLNLAGNRASLLDQSNKTTDYQNAITNPNRVIGDEKLYLKGGQGSVAVIELFDKKDILGYDKEGNLTGANGVSDELDKIRKEGWLINEANLVFNVDAASMKDKDIFEPNRIYLYDYTNNRGIIDYFIDGSTAINPKNSRFVFGGILNKSTVTKRGSNYKVRITNHIRALVKNADSTNVKLGVAVTESIDIVTSNNLFSPTAKISEVPMASVMNPLGTIIYGGRSSTNPNETNLLKLEIFYTKPK